MNQKETGQSLDEGKQPMSFDQYKLMARKLFESDAHDALFAHTFLVLEYNLMARANNCVEMEVVHVEWRQDCLAFFPVK